MDLRTSSSRHLYAQKKRPLTYIPPHLVHSPPRSHTVHPCIESAYPEHTSPVVAACQKIRSTPVGQPGAFKPLLVAPGKCLNISDDSTRSQFLPFLPLRLAPGAATAGEAWYYLACTEIIHPIAANNKTDMVGSAMMYSRLSQRLQSNYGEIG